MRTDNLFQLWNPYAVSVVSIDVSHDETFSALRVKLRSESVMNVYKTFRAKDLQVTHIEHFLTKPVL